MNIKEIVKEYPDGFSISVKDNSIFTSEYGYAIAITDMVIDLPYIETAYRELLSMGNVLNYPSEKLLVGGWVDKNNKQYLDLSLFIEDKKVAIQIAKVFNQKAIFSFSDMDDIEVCQ